MNVLNALFYLFSSIAIGLSLMVVFAKNPVRAVLSLVGAFFAMTCIWMILEAEFLAVALILVYVGAVMVLFLFVVMMLDIEMPQMKQSILRQIPSGLMILALMIGALTLAVGQDYFGLENFAEPARNAADYNNIKSLGSLLYTEYLLPFEVAGLILLVAMVAAIGLAFRGRRAKGQTVSKQTYVTKADRLKVISMDAEKR